MTDSAAERDPAPFPIDQRSDEQALVDRVRSSDSSAFETIVKRHGPGMAAFAQAHVHSRETAEEIVQEIFLAIWANRRQWTLTHSLKTYLYQSVRKRVLNHRRDTRTADRHLAELAAQSLSVSANDYFPGQADAPLSEAELRAALDAAIAELPERCRQAFTLSREQYLSYAEIAAVLGISVRTVEVHITRALASLRLKLIDWQR